MERRRVGIPTHPVNIASRLIASESSCSLPETRSRKISALQAPMAHTINGFLPIPDSSRESKRKTMQSLPPSSPVLYLNDNDSSHTLGGTPDGPEGYGRSRSKERHLQKQRQKELAKAKKMAEAKEKEIEREQRMRLKDQEQRQKLKLKISGPIFNENNLRDGTRNLEEIRTGAKTVQGSLSMPVESDRKARSLHGFQHDDERPSLGFGLAMTSEELRQSTLRKARSNSILQGVKTVATNRFSRKKGALDGNGSSLERTHHPRAQSISNLSALTQKPTGVSSFSGYENSNPPPVPSISTKTMMSIYETLGSGPAPSLATQLSLYNLSQKQLPALPSNGSAQGNWYDSDKQQPMSMPLPSADPPASPSTMSPRRRMSMAAFIKEPKATSLSGMAALKKTLANSSRISLRLKPEDISVDQATHDGVTTPRSPDGRSKSPGPSNLRKSGIANWIGWRKSSVHQVPTVATNELVTAPVGTLSASSSPPQSPVPSASSSTDTGFTQPIAQEHQYDKPSSQRSTRSRKKSAVSTKSTSSIISSLRSTWLPDSPQSTSTSKFANMSRSPPRSFSRDEIQPCTPLKSEDLEYGGPLDTTHLAMDSTNNALRLVHPHEPIQHDQHLSSASKPVRDVLTVDPLLPSESPSDAFVLLTPGNDAPSLFLEHGPEGSVLVSVEDKNEGNALLNNRDRVEDQPVVGHAEPSIPRTVSDLTPNQQNEDHTVKQVIQDSLEYVHIKKGDLPERDRERVRKIASTYIKIKNPSPGIVVPRPKTIVQAHQDGAVDEHRTHSPTEPTSAFSLKSASSNHRTQRLLSSVTGGLANETPLSSPNPSLASHTLTAGSSRGESTKQNITTTEERSSSIETDMASKNDESVTTPPPSPARVVRGANLSANQMTLQRFMSDFQSKLWFTYRKDMARIEPSFYNSDAGWGCMMRTGQSLLAQAFVCVMLGRGKFLSMVHLKYHHDIECDG